MTQADENKGEVITLHPTPKVDLHSPNAVRRELASVYRDMRSSKIETQDGTRLGYMLNLLLKAHETCVLEKDLQRIKSTLKVRANQEKEIQKLKDRRENERR